MIEEVKKLKCGEIKENVDMRKYTTYKTGGIAKLMVFPKNIDSLIKLLKYIKNNNIKHKILGKGSNILFSDDYYDGIIIKLDEFKNIEIDDTKIIVGAGYSLVKLALQTARLGLTGLEFASGIPGSIGGAIFMNAGAYKSDMGYIVESVKVLTPQLEIKTLSNKEMDFHYRTSFIKKNPDYICLEATINLVKGDRDLILELISDRKRRRLESQPLEFPSAGSVFRNPEGDYAGRLIEEICYKGKRIGDAKVSDKHANFIINIGHAKSEDIKTLISEIKKIIKQKYNIDLKVEQEFVE